jgi:hypothetical protein
MEIPLLEGLQFDLIVHLPYNPLHGFIIDLKVRHLSYPSRVVLLLVIIITTSMFTMLGVAEPACQSREAAGASAPSH